MSADEFRAWLIVVIRDGIIPLVGVYITVRNWPLEPYHYPLVGGMMGVPFVARGGDPPDDEPPDDSAKQEG